MTGIWGTSMDSLVSAPQAVLIGPPGAGKTTVGLSLASLLGVEFRDTDRDVEVSVGKSISDIFADDGEPAFRALERAAVAAALEEHRGVLSLGGGAVLDPHTAELLRNYRENGGLVVFLNVSLAAAAPRVGFNVSRPLLAGNPRARWAELMQQRRPIYESLASLVVLTDELQPGEIAQLIAKELK